MKKLLAAVAFLSLTGCLPIEFDKSKTMTFNVHYVNAEDNGALESTVDLSDDEDLKQYGKYIQSIEVASAKATVTAINTETPSVCTKASGTMTVSSDGAAPIQLAHYEELALTVGNSKELSLDQAGATAVGTYLLGAGRKFTVRATGDVDQRPCHFDVEVTVQLKVKAKAGI